MPARRDIRSICVLGSGPIVIGQAAEFDYSGTQAVQALKAEGYRVVLVNSNPATIMTDPGLADATYIEPLTPEMLERVLDQERPDALLPTVGGQTALNLAIDLEKAGVLQKYGVELIGAEVDVIERAEDRSQFKETMKEIGVETARSMICHTIEAAQKALDVFGLPIVIRPSFTMGGAGGGIAYTEDEFVDIVTSGLSQSPTTEVLVEESILGWKEYEYEVMRDSKDNAVIVCSIENLDPMGVHTGDSITVAPAQTLTDREYQRLRNQSLAIIRAIGVKTGGSNVQFAVCPKTGRSVAIEMNPRVSRSSALASKATGYPIAKIAALVAVGYTLDEVPNDITQKTQAAFEPSIDYVVTKIPRFAFEKFAATPRVLTTQMRSVGEAMAIGRTFTESLGKALRSLEHGTEGLEPSGITKVGGPALPADDAAAMDALRARLAVPCPERPWLVADAMRRGMDNDEIHAITAIDPWFLAHMRAVVDQESAVATAGSLDALDADALWTAKQRGMSDARIAQLVGTSADAVRAARKAAGVIPVYKRIDTCAAEFEAHTPYMYSTYERPVYTVQDGALVAKRACESKPTGRRKVIILGGGPIRIGQGIEFDYCCVHAVYALQAQGFETIMVNCNPETVSTDYDTADRLYFEPITLEHVLDIVELEQPEGVIVQLGGQTPLKLARALEAAGVPILGTTPDAIDRAEDRERSAALVEKLGLRQPEAGMARSAEEAETLADKLGYPVLLRPSYVLGGRAMQVVHSPRELRHYLETAVMASDDRPVLVDRFLDGAIEVDVDVLCDRHTVVIGGIMQHVQEAGVHSGDSACVLPPHTLPRAVVEEIAAASRALALELGVKGLMNAQFAVQRSRVYVIEVNPRASRTVPFVSKATGIPLAQVGARVMAGESLASFGLSDPPLVAEDAPHIAVKEAVLPFIKFPGQDVLLGPEMRSTGEVMGIDTTYAAAFAKAQQAGGMLLPSSGTVFVSVADVDKDDLVDHMAALHERGFSIVATGGTARFLELAGVPTTRINKVSEGLPHVVSEIHDGNIDLIFNTALGEQSIADSAQIRRQGLERGVPYFTTTASIQAACAAIGAQADGALGVDALQRRLRG